MAVGLPTFGRRNMNIRALWRKRDVTTRGDNAFLTYETQATIFYAMEVGQRIVDADDALSGTTRNPYLETTIMSYDDLSEMRADDKVIFNDKEYIVTNVSIEVVNMRSEFIKTKIYNVTLRSK